MQRRQFLAASAALYTVGARAQNPDFWSRLREGGNVILMRHSQTEPGVGDPPGFRLGECSTQRNLSAEGREQARRTGEAFRREGIRLDDVRASAWCRCIDTAQLAFGRHTVWTPINSFFGGQGERDAQTRAVLEAVRSLRAPTNWMLVTHQVNITALTGDYPAMGEVFVARPQAGSQRLQVVARQGF